MSAVGGLLAIYSYEAGRTEGYLAALADVRRALDLSRWAPYERRVVKSALAEVERLEREAAGKSTP